MNGKEFNKRVPWWLPPSLTLGPYCLALGHITGGQDRVISFGVALVGATLLINALLWLAYNLAAVAAVMEKHGTSISLGTPRPVLWVTISVVAMVLVFKVTT